MPNVEVNCAVSNCVFHKKGNVCGASEIKIDMDNNAKSTTLTEFASDFDAHITSEEVNNSSDTCCKTFKPKENNNC